MGERAVRGGRLEFQHLLPPRYRLRTPPASKYTYTSTKLHGENSKSAAFFGVTSLPDVHLRAQVSWASFPVDAVLVSSVHHSNE